MKYLTSGAVGTRVDYTSFEVKSARVILLLVKNCSFVNV